MIHPVTMVVHCTGCAGTATIKFEDAGAGEEASWVCPHCQTRHPLGVVGRVAWAIRQTVDVADDGPLDGGRRGRRS